MNRFLVLISLCCLTVGTTAQNWFPFPLGQKSFYEYDGIYFPMTGSDSAISVYHCDSVANFGNYQIYHFNYTTPDYYGCFAEVNNNPFFWSPIRDESRPDSIIQINDTLLLAFSFNFPNDVINFLPKIEKDSSWFSPYTNQLFAVDSLKFTCDSIYLDTVVGNIVDSIKLISIQAYLNSNPITSDFDSIKLLLSKNYGFKQFVSFKHVKRISLIGLDSGNTQAGFQTPKLQDYFHLNPGDAIIWEERYSSFNIFSPPNYTLYFKDSIIGVVSTPDSVIYSFIRSYSASGSMAPGGTNSHYKEKLKALELPTSIFVDKNSMEFWGVWSFWNNDLYKSSVIYKTSDTILNRKFEWEGENYDSTNCASFQVTDVWNGVRYNTKYGLTSYYRGNNDDDWAWTIVGSKINGIEEGNYWQVGIEEAKMKQTFSIYPNPSNQNMVKVIGENIETIEVFNLQSQQLLKSTETKVSTGQLAKGIYLVKVTFKNGEVATQKLILSR